MKHFIVAVPMFNEHMVVEAYRMKTQNGVKLFGMSDDYTALNDATLSPGLDSIARIGLEPFTGGKPIFINVNHFLLLMNAPQNGSVPPDKLVCVLPKDFPVDADIMAKCARIRDLGYTFALDNMPLSPETDYLFDLADYVMLDYGGKNFKELLIQARSKYRNKKIVIYDVSTNEAYVHLRGNLSNALYEGRFYSQPITRGMHNISALKANALQLLRLVSDDDFDLTNASDIISRDPAISIALFRFINTPRVGITRTIDSIKSAVALLGQKETKKWVMVTISAQLAEDKPNEITKLALVRAKFAENLATAFLMGIHAPSLFIAGLFSLLDIILNKSMADAMNEVSVNNRIKDALVNKKGSLYEVLELIYYYERADWENVSLIMVRKDISIDAITNAFTEALIWYKKLAESIPQE